MQLNHQLSAYLPAYVASPEMFVKVANYVEEIAVHQLAAGKNKSVQDPENIWWREYAEEHLRYEKEGVVPSVTVVIERMTRGGITFGSSRSGTPYEASFLEALRAPFENAEVQISSVYGPTITLSLSSSATGVRYEHIMPPAPDEPDAVEAIEGLRRSLSPFESPPAPVIPGQPFRVFIGHGGDEQWRVLRDDLRDVHGFDTEVFERSPRAGHHISAILERMAGRSTAALLVLTKTDAMAGSGMRGRQNVVHEIGFFQGKLGWQNAIVVAEEGVDLFSNIDGTQQIRFPSGNIRAAVGEAVGALRVLQTAHERQGS